MMNSKELKSLTAAVSGVINPAPAPVTEGAEKDTKGDKEAYQKFFKKTLKKYGADSPEDLSDDDKKKFYDEIDAGWKADDEKPEKNESVELEEAAKISGKDAHKWLTSNKVFDDEDFANPLSFDDAVKSYRGSGPGLDAFINLAKKHGGKKSTDGWGWIGGARNFYDKVLVPAAKGYASIEESVELEEEAFKGESFLNRVEKYWEWFKVNKENDYLSSASAFLNDFFNLYKNKGVMPKHAFKKATDLKGMISKELKKLGISESVELEEDFGSDEAMVMELELFAENDRGLYNQFRSIIKNLIGKEINGKYDHKAAIKLWGYYADAAAKAYAKEFGGPDFRSLLTVRRDLAKKLADQELPAIKGALQGVNMEYEDLLPKNKKKIEAYRASMNESVELEEGIEKFTSNLTSNRGKNVVTAGYEIKVGKEGAKVVDLGTFDSVEDALRALKKVKKWDERWYTLGNKQFGERKISEDTLEEKRKSKSDYEIYHDSYTSALSEVLDLVDRNGFKVNEDLWFSQVSSGPRKPSVGKTNSFNLELEKDGKETRKVVSFQVYGLDSGRYELNAYIS